MNESSPTKTILVSTIFGALAGLFVFLLFGPKATKPAVAAAANAPRQVMVQTIFDCQYLVIENPGGAATILHHGGCSNRLHYVSAVPQPFVTTLLSTTNRP